MTKEREIIVLNKCSYHCQIKCIYNKTLMAEINMVVLL